MNNRTLLSKLHWIICALFMFSVQAYGGGLMSFDPTGFKAQIADTLRVSTMIREQVAVTKTTQVFRNTTSNPATAMYGFSVPASAMVTNLRWEINGIWYLASMKSNDTATQVTPEQSTPSSFGKFFDGIPFTFPFKETIAPNATITVELTYVELLPYKNGKFPYRYAMTTPSGNSSITIHEWKVDIQSGRELSDVVANSASAAITKQTSTSVEMLGTMITPIGNEVSLSFTPHFDALTMNVLSTKPANEDGYALMMAVPQSTTTDEDIMPKRITFVIDRSGSMSGNRIQYAKLAAERCVRGLDQDDVFNVIRFDDRNEVWSEDHSMGPDHQPATQSKIESAVTFIQSTSARGGTNIMSALNNALKRHRADSYVNVIIFLTDGEAQVAFDELKTLNTSDTRIFVFGLGYGINRDVLTRIGNEHNGASFFIEQESMIVPAITDLYNIIKDPIIKNPAVTFSPSVMYDVYPSIVPDIYKGQQLLLVGRYTTPGDVTVTVNGSNRNGNVSLPFAANLTDDPNINTFVAKIWAKYRIDMLVQWMKDEPNGSSRWKEWRDELIRLGTTYGIVTPFTSLVDNGTKDNSTSVTNDAIDVVKDRCSISPNPVRDHTTIRLDLRDVSRLNVRIQIVDLQGRIVRVLYTEEMAPEVLELEWNGADDNDVQVGSGSYRLIISLDGIQSSTTINVTR